MTDNHRGEPVAFVTGSHTKYEIAVEHLRPFGIELEHADIDLTEIQSPSVEAIAGHKAAQAFAMLRRPVIVEDSGFGLDELGGFPGTSVKHLISTAGPAAIAHLAGLTTSRACTSVAALTYAHASGKQTTFCQSRPGTIATEPHGDAGRLALWTVYCPPGSAVPLAAMTPDGLAQWQQWWAANSVFAEFGRWYTSHAGPQASAARPAGLPGDPVAAAKAIAAELFPHAQWVWLTGSVITASRTATSDLDLIVICDPTDCPRPYRESLTAHGFPAELFVNTEAGLPRYLDKDDRRPILHRMIATAVVIAGDEAAAWPWQQQCRAFIDHGPPSLTPAQLAWARYSLTDRLTDLDGSTDAVERQVIAASIWCDTAELFLGLKRHWTGSGKWLAREITDCDPVFAARWAAAQHDPAALAREVLALAGGPLFDGYTDRPSASELP